MYSAQIIPVQTLKASWLNGITADVLRLDMLHPVVSGNKWFKIKYYLEEAKALHKVTVATFGGPFSNHIIATAYACKEAGLKSTGIIRGEKPPQLSLTLQDAMSQGMELVFVSREYFRQKEFIKSHYPNKNWYWLNEGGYGEKGMLGARDILQTIDASAYTHIICACGTGTTLAGLVEAALPHQICIGISALKGHTGLEEDVRRLLPPTHKNKSFSTEQGFHFGGYAKHPAPLTEWMNTLWRDEQLATDIVYTSKLMYAVKQMIARGDFSMTDRLLIIHSGGLQGNRSLPKGTLEFL